MKPFELNDLPQYSRWIAELLSDQSNKRVKDEQQILREFGREKWGALLARWIDNPCGVDTVRSWGCSPERVHAGLVNAKLMLMTASESHSYYVNLIEQELLDDGARDLVEIGCGFGSILFELVARGRLNYDSTTGLEYTQQGIDLAKNLANWHQFDVRIGNGDFSKVGVSDLEIKPNSDILTSYSFHYVRDSALALANIAKLKPRRVIHFEPIFQHYNEQTVLGLFQQRYMKLNDYTVSHHHELMNLSSQGRVEIIKEVPLVFGSNCLLPASIIVWRPVV